MQKWQYALTVGNLHEKKVYWDLSLLWEGTDNPYQEMNKLGQAGWEMVAAIPIHGRLTTGALTQLTTHILFVYKRPIDESDNKE